MTDKSGGQKPSLGFWRSWAMVVGSMIGSGIFMIPALLAPYGGMGLIGWLVSSAGAIVIALTLGNLARRIPAVGGTYAYSRAGFGDFAGFLVAWTYWISVWIACAAIAVAFVSYLGVLLPFVSATPAVSALSGIVVIWILIGVNLMGVREMGLVQLVTTILKLLPLIVIGAVGLYLVEPQSFLPINPTNQPHLTVLSAVVVLTMWPFMGLDAATVPANDVIEPKKTLPRALVAGTITAALVYMAATYAVMGLVPADQLASSTTPFADAATRLVGRWGAVAIAIGAMISTFGALNVNLCCASQVTMAAADDGLFPRKFSEKTSRNVPGFALIVVGTLCSVLLLTNYTRGLLGVYLFLLLISTILTLFTYIFSAMAALMLEARDPEMTPNSRFKEGLVAVLAFGAGLWAIAAAGQESVYWAFILLMLGLPVYVFVARKNHVAAQAEAAE